MPPTELHPRTTRLENPGGQLLAGSCPWHETPTWPPKEVPQYVPDATGGPLLAAPAGTQIGFG